jgi:hypothetical protein
LTDAAYDFPMNKLIFSWALLALTVTFVSSLALAQESVIGVLEDNHGWYAGEPNFRAVRVVFRKVGLDWKAFPNDCPDQQCLKTVAARYPRELTWTIAFDGKNLGHIVSRTPKEFKWYAAVGQQEIVSAGRVPTVGQQEIVSAGRVPTVGQQSSEFGGYTEAVVYRPLVANSRPYSRDPEEWKPATASDSLNSILRTAFRKRFPKLCRLGGPESNRMDAYPYRNEDVKLVKTYASKTGWTIARLHLQAVDCSDVEAGFDIDDPWFAAAPNGSVTHLDDGMWLVDAGDYDNDGKSELLFSIDREDHGGYEMFYNDFRKHVAFQFSYH